MTIGIYRFYCTEDKKSYVGQSIDIEKRCRNHLRKLNRNDHPCLHLQRAWNKYGADSFQFEILQECREEGLTSAENKWIKRLSKKTKLFNTRLAAESNRGLKKSPATRLKHSIAGKKNGVPDAWLDRAKQVKGKKKTPEELAKNFLSRIKRTKSPEHLARLALEKLERIDKKMRAGN